ncbi:CCA-adding enzyme [Candidatus Entotheonellaceae bacterium PAL068K]
MPFVRALQERGARVYTVGGTVRDGLLRRPRKDVDLVVTAIPQNALIRLLRQHGHVQLIGRAFGVIQFLPRHWAGSPIDVALPRTEVSTGIGHRDFAVTFDHTLPIETDLGRRDFTINAMALNLADDRLIDPFGGQADLTQRVLRQVSEAAFPEDPLRMLRGVQLVTRFDLHVEPNTRKAMCRHAASIATIAPERIAEELRKLFQATAPSRGFFLMHDVGLLSHIIPEIARLVDRQPGPVGASDVACLPHTSPQPDALTHTLRRLDAIQQRDESPPRHRLDLLLAALLQDSVPPEAWQADSPRQSVAELSAHLARQRLEALKMTTIGAHLTVIHTLIAESAFEANDLVTDAGLRHFAHRVGPDVAFLLLALRLADRQAHHPPQPIDDLLTLRQRLQSQIDRNVPLHLKDLAINGNDLQRLGLMPGPRLGRLLQALLHRVLDDPTCNTRDDLLAMAQMECGMQNAACRM